MSGIDSTVGLPAFLLLLLHFQSWANKLENNLEEIIKKTHEDNNSE
jgi:hypothetical protein